MLGEKLKELRKSKRLLQRQVAADLSVETAYTSKLENNDKTVSKTHLGALTKVYDFPECELLSF